MKKFFSLSLTLLAAVVAFASVCVATPEQEKAFVDQYKKAFESNDTKSLESMLYTKDADPEALEFYKMMMAPEAGSKISKIELRDLTPEETKKASATMPSPSGGMSKLPVTPTKKLVLNITSGDANGSSTSSSESYVALVDGKYLIPVPAPVK